MADVPPLLILLSMDFEIVFPLQNVKNSLIFIYRLSLIVDADSATSTTALFASLLSARKENRSKGRKILMKIHFSKRLRFLCCCKVGRGESGNVENSHKL